MLRVDRICIYILIVGFLFLIPSVGYVKYIDEVCAFLFAAVALLDCLCNGCWKKYKLLWCVIGIMAFYAVYSLICVHFNTLPYILMDLVVEIKIFIPFFVLAAVAPVLTAADRDLFRKIALLNVSIISLTFLGGPELIKIMVTHPAYAGIDMFASVLFYMYASIDSDGRLSMRDQMIIIVFLTIGLACTRSKYFGEYVLALFFLLVYRPRMFKRITLKHIILLLVVAGLIIAVSWNKIQYYFLTGEAETFDPNEVATFARPVLYATGFMILIDFFPFGSGLASFATFASSANYSDLYYEYNIDKVYGLSPNMGDFICDAFYPSLAQFGVVGLILFVTFWIYVFNQMKILIRTMPHRYKYEYVIGCLIIWFALIESIGGTAITQSSGMILLGLLGLECGLSKRIEQKNGSAIESKSFPSKSVLSPQKI